MAREFVSTIWRRPLVRRRYGAQEIVDGYAVKPSHEDTEILVDVQFVSGSDTSVEAEGKRSTARIRTYGDDICLTADVKTGRPADRLWYQGTWWECESVVVRDKTIVCHCRATWVRASEADDEEAPEIETEPDETGEDEEDES